ncbi:hypothetical protein DUI87_00516 [Hirundo rustica rustica]|uniref:Uncharacterized protein n=1 Tax=Hirundo rustica rustica TaxID=333673 RepID=A0A3M0LB48_HIRRU|nr:hypothetical protein DUI87_00516 [Hirundo rustica rustica]
MAAAALPLLLLLLAAGAAARWEATPETPYELPDGSIAVSIRNQAQYRREPDAALELRQRQHVVGAWLRVWGGAQRVLGRWRRRPPRNSAATPPWVYLIYEKGRSVPTESVSLATISLAGDL